MRCTSYCNEPNCRGGRFIGFADKGPPKNSINRGDNFLGRGGIRCKIQLLLSLHIDKLFDRYWISFNATGELLCEHEAAKEALRYWGINGANLIRSFNREQESFLKGHREQLRY